MLAISAILLFHPDACYFRYFTQMLAISVILLFCYFSFTQMLAISTILLLCYFFLAKNMLYLLLFCYLCFTLKCLLFLLFCYFSFHQDDCYFCCSFALLLFVHPDACYFCYFCYFAVFFTLMFAISAYFDFSFQPEVC